MKLVVMVALLTIALSNAYAEELLGIQNVKCGGKIFKATSITTVSPTELVDTKGITHDVRSDGIGQGGAYEWACIRFDKSYLVFRGSAMVRLSDLESINLDVHDVFDTAQEHFVRTGEMRGYADLLENHKSKIAKKRYPKLDAIYHHARFKKFVFELSD